MRVLVRGRRGFPWKGAALYFAVILTAAIRLGVAYLNRTDPRLLENPIPEEFTPYALGILFTLLVQTFQRSEDPPAPPAAPSSDPAKPTNP